MRATERDVDVLTGCKSPISGELDAELHVARLGGIDCCSGGDHAVASEAQVVPDDSEEANHAIGDPDADCCEAPVAER